MRHLAGLAVILACLFANVGGAQQPVARIPILFDTDIGGDLDDGFALALILASPELDLRGVTAVSGPVQQRGLMLCRFLTMTGRRHVNVALGSDPQPMGREIKALYYYYYHPDVLFNRTIRPQKETAVDFLYAKLKAQPGKVTLVATGPLTNIARLLSEKPDARTLIKNIVCTEGAPGFSNFEADEKAARAVFASGVPRWVIPTSTTKNLQLDPARCERIFGPGTALSLQIQTMYQMWDRENPTLADPLAVAVCLKDDLVKWEEKTSGDTKIRIAVSAPSILDWFTDRLASRVSPSDKPAKFVPQGNMPNRVHVAEDYDNDIERRWWMSGKAELKNLPAGSTRACRGVLTHDFDDLLGNPKAMHTAVIFNPVPGPPMGKNPRLSFRYWLKGTDTIRVQIYSLTNGYHRHLILKDVPQGKWQTGTVDMTDTRRPDGTGGPLGEGERIDDIQWYVDPRAEILIDDVFLYDAAPAGEKRPFPKRVFFSGLFDSGKQGTNWPGDFKIVQDKGVFWHAAQSIPSAEGDPWIRLHLRGPRTLGEKTHLSFRYHLTGADSLQVLLVNPKTTTQHRQVLKNLNRERWGESTIAWNDTRAGEQVEEIHFLVPRGGELLIDDVLFFEPVR